MTVKRAKEQEEKAKSLTPKEREEYKKFQARLSGATISHNLLAPWLKSFQVNKYLNAAETGPKMNHLKKTELPLTSLNTSALSKWRTSMKRIESISVIVIRGEGNADEPQRGL